MAFWVRIPVGVHHTILMFYNMNFLKKIFICIGIFVCFWFANILIFIGVIMEIFSKITGECIFQIANKLNALEFKYKDL